MFEIGVENTLMAAVTLLAGAAAALALGFVRGRKNGLDTRSLVPVTLLLPLGAAFVSHLGYCLADLENVLYSHSAWYLLAFWERGYMFYGGLAGVIIGKKVGNKISGKAGILGGVILIYIGLQIFVQSWL